MRRYLSIPLSQSCERCWMLLVLNNFIIPIFYFQKDGIGYILNWYSYLSVWFLYYKCFPNLFFCFLIFQTFGVIEVQIFSRCIFFDCVSESIRSCILSFSCPFSKIRFMYWPSCSFLHIFPCYSSSSMNFFRLSRNFFPSLFRHNYD
jgi:hypothetical protein